MHINSISGINFKGLLVIKNPNKTCEQAVNTDQVVEIKDMGTKYHPHTIIHLTTGGDAIKVNIPFDEVIQAYQKAASTSSFEIKSEN